MPQFITNITKQLNSFWAGMERPKRIKLIVFICILVLLVTTMVIMLNKKEYVTLYNGLSASDAGEVLSKLQEMGIEAKPVGDDTIMVLKEQEPGVRMQLSAQGYPKSGFNYDLFMNGIGFGTTDYEKRKYLQFQLQDRLQEAIRTLNGVSDAIVTISVPDEDSFVFKSEKQAAAASVILKLNEGYKITPKQVKAIEELVAKSILGLLPENISIIDSDMNLLSAQDDSESELAGSQLELENQVRNRLQKQVASILEPVFGYGKVLAAVNVKLNFDKQIKETVRFEPVVDDSGLVVSMSELKEKVKNQNNGGGVPGQDSNGDAIGYPASSQSTGSDYEKISNTVNYELNEIREQLESARGQIKELSVSVVIDSADMSADMKKQVGDIVAGAVGIDSGNVVVENMSFKSTGLQEQISEAMSAGRMKDRTALAKDLAVYGMLAIIALVIIIAAYNLLKESIKTERTAAAVSLMSSLEEAAAASDEASILQDKQSNVQKEIDQLVRQKPDDVAKLLRTWLSED